MDLDRIKEDTNIQRIKELIVKSVHPQEIYLFGSRARGQNRADSDYDFLILSKEEVNEREITRKVNLSLLQNKIDVETDIISTSLSKWNANKEKNGWIYKEIEAEGLKIYG
jgi:predicted nucleotidyltransferase